jgi:hypothetical protein
MARSTFRIFRFAVLATSVIAIVGATLVAPDSSAESAPRDSRSKFFEKFESLAEYSESNGGSPQTWMPETRVSRNAWTSSVADESVRIDSQGRAFVVDSLAVEQTPVVPSAQPAAPAANVLLSDAFLLNSLPGANRTIYLDFTGHSLAGTYWQLNISQSGDGPDYTDEQMQMPAYDVDGDTATFNNLERRNIIDAWSAVAEDYAPFDVNVTTQDPGSPALLRSNEADVVYGVRALITDSANIIGSTCGCGGIAYVDVFDYARYNTYLGPALNFAQSWFTGKTISDVVSHEVGHNLGLMHDGGINPPETVAEGYYDGHDGWAPVMGVGYYEPLVQFSNGTYTSANQFQDDVAVMAGNGISRRVDDHGGTLFTATAVTLGTDDDGVISSRTDVDYFRFVASASSHEIQITSPSSSSNLDVEAQLLDSLGNVMSTTNPNLLRVGVDNATGLDASFSASTVQCQVYYVRVDGVGYGTGALTGYSDYGSLGEFRIAVTGTPTLELESGTPSITGSTVFGSTLTGSTGTWTEGSELTAQWYRNGVATGVTDSTYSPLAGDVGKSITYRVEGSKTGYCPGQATSSAVIVTGATISTQSTPTVSGTGAVGTTLTGSTGMWLDGVSFSTQWYRNGSAASDSDSSYTILPSDLGKTLVFRVIASKAGYNPVTANSVSTTVIAGTISPTATPTITGTAKVGKKLSSNVGTWQPGVTLKRQWLRNGSPISRATGSTYKLKSTDKGKKISVKVTAAMTGYNSEALISAQTAKVRR